MDVNQIIKKISNGAQLPLKTDENGNQTIYDEPAENFLRKSFIYDGNTSTFPLMGNTSFEIENNFIPIGYRAEIIYKTLCMFIKKIVKEDVKNEWNYPKSYKLVLSSLPSDEDISNLKYFNVIHYNCELADKNDYIDDDIASYDLKTKVITFDVVALKKHIKEIYKAFLYENIQTVISCEITRYILRELFHAMHHKDLYPTIEYFDDKEVENMLISGMSINGYSFKLGDIENNKFALFDIVYKRLRVNFTNKICSKHHAIELFIEYETLSFLNGFFKEIIVALHNACIPVRYNDDNKPFYERSEYIRFIENKLELIKTFNINFIWNINSYNKIIFSYKNKYLDNDKNEKIKTINDELDIRYDDYL